MMLCVDLIYVDLEFETPSRYLKSLYGQTKVVPQNKTTTNVLYIIYLIIFVNILVISEEMLLVRFTGSFKRRLDESMDRDE